jgi:predicted nucleic acid-binding protein
VYAEGLGELAKCERATALITAVPMSSILVPAQVLGELFNVLVRKARRSPAEAQGAIRFWQDGCSVAPTTEAVLTRAIELGVEHGLAIWDAIILAAAAEAGCRMLLSDDMQEGFTWGGVTIVNPFASPPHKLLDDLRG